MEIINSTVKTPETESETPTRIQTAKPLPFTNGLLKRHAPLQLHHHHHPVVVTYKECLKNHAAALGGHAVDGCGEFMPSPASNPADPTSLRCAACGCHRNFHRREPEDPLGTQSAVPAIEYRPLHRHHPPPPAQPANSEESPDSPPSSPPPISSSYYPSAPHALMALGHVMSGQVPDSGGALISAAACAGSGSRKRFRTKFTSDQKEKMLQLADRVGWKMQKRDEDAINDVCTEIGVDKGVFKVWMHNNKHNFAKKDQHHPPNSTINPAANGIATTYPTTPGGGIYGSDNKDHIRCPELAQIHLHIETSSADILGTTTTNGPSSC